MRRHVDVFVGITAIHDSAETIHVRDQWFGSIDTHPPAERRERAAAAAALVDFITVRCAPDTHSAIECAEGALGRMAGDRANADLGTVPPNVRLKLTARSAVELHLYAFQLGAAA
jgi:hypothetical protein